MLGGVEERLIARCREGDPQAWSEVVETYSGYIYAIVKRGFRLEEHEAEDVFQEVFARLFEHLDSIRDDAAVRYWIGQTARRLAIDSLRRSGREAPSSEDELPEPGAPDPMLERLDTALDVRAGVELLPPHCREVILRFFIQDQSYRTIGEEMDIPSGTIASRISRCLATLRELLGEAKPV